MFFHGDDNFVRSEVLLALARLKDKDLRKDLSEVEERRELEGGVEVSFSVLFEGGVDAFGVDRRLRIPVNMLFKVYTHTL